MGLYLGGGEESYIWDANWLHIWGAYIWGGGILRGFYYILKVLPDQYNVSLIPSSINLFLVEEETAPLKKKFLNRTCKRA